MKRLVRLQDAFEFNYVSIRLTATMLEKSIIDAHDALRTQLAAHGVVEYQAIGQGGENKVSIDIPLLHSDGVDERKVTFYRPNTKSGDPRTWIYGLKRNAAAGDLLLFLFDRDAAPGSSGLVGLMVLGDDVDALLRDADQLLRRRSTTAVDRSLAGVAERIRRQLAPLRETWIRTKRPGDTGIGYTLEELLGIPANTFKGADVDGVELKAYRRGAATGQGKLVSLFSKTPNWVHPDKGLGLIERYGYYDEKRDRQALYCTVNATPNSLGLGLDIAPDAQRMNVVRGADLACYYHLRTLEARLAEKHTATLFIQASRRGVGRAEEFRFDGLVYCRNASIGNFLDLVAADQLGVDFTLHIKANGKARDHGYLWRVREPKIAELFAYRREFY